MLLNRLTFSATLSNLTALDTVASGGPNTHLRAVPLFKRIPCIRLTLPSSTVFVTAYPLDSCERLVELYIDCWILGLRIMTRAWIWCELHWFSGARYKWKYEFWAQIRFGRGYIDFIIGQTVNPWFHTRSTLYSAQAFPAGKRSTSWWTCWASATSLLFKHF